MGKLVRRTLGGDSIVLEWSADDADSVRAAAEAMQREVQAGYTAVLGGEGRHEPLDHLPPDADVVILTMPMGGGWDGGGGARRGHRGRRWALVAHGAPEGGGGVAWLGPAAAGRRRRGGLARRGGRGGARARPGAAGAAGRGR